MANFAVSASEETILKGRKLIERLQTNGEKQGDVLDRIFSIVENNLNNIDMKEEGIDVEALEASLSNIRALFVASTSGKDEIRRRYEQQIIKLKQKGELREEELTKELETAKASCVQACEETMRLKEQFSSMAKELDAYKEQVRVTQELAKEHENAKVALQERLEEQQEKVDGYEIVKASERRLLSQVTQLETEAKKESQQTSLEYKHQIEQLKASHQFELAQLKTSYEHQIEQLKAEQALELEKARLQMERAFSDKLREVDRENARLLSKIELLEIQLNPPAHSSH